MSRFRDNMEYVKNLSDEFIKHAESMSLSEEMIYLIKQSYIEGYLDGKSDMLSSLEDKLKEMGVV